MAFNSNIDVKETPSADKITNKSQNPTKHGEHTDRKETLLAPTRVTERISKHTTASNMLTFQDTKGLTKHKLEKHRQKTCIR